MSIRTSEQLNELGAALAKAQGAIRGAVKDAENPHFKSKYADLASVWDACREPLSANGLAVVQTLSNDGALVRVTTMLVHGSGQWIADDLLLPAGATPQTAGSAITYGRRYGLAAIAGVAPEDDDANEASKPAAKAQAPAPARVPVPDGFDDWWSDITAAADGGMAKLEAAWKASPADRRDYVLNVKASAWASLKAKASKVTA